MPKLFLPSSVSQIYPTTLHQKFVVKYKNYEFETEFRQGNNNLSNAGNILGFYPVYIIQNKFAMKDGFHDILLGYASINVSIASSPILDVIETQTVPSSMVNLDIDDNVLYKRYIYNLREGFITGFCVYKDKTDNLFLYQPKRPETLRSVTIYLGNSLKTFNKILSYPTNTDYSPSELVYSLSNSSSTNPLGTINTDTYEAYHRR
jgi:hypothetical protein